MFISGGKAIEFRQQRFKEGAEPDFSCLYVGFSPTMEKRFDKTI
jgi:hypothetical protein